MGETLLDYAVAYAEAGHRVFPLWTVRPNGTCECNNKQCPSPGKHPHGRLVPRGVSEATDDEATVKAWWRTYPQGNIGVATGDACFVVDCDKTTGPDGVAIDGIALFREMFPGDLEDHARAATGGGGLHVCFATDPDVRVTNQQGAFLDGARHTGIDIRGEGGYIVAPPSRHVSGRCYEWMVDLEYLRPAPAWLLEQLNRPMEHAPVVAEKPKGLPWEKGAKEKGKESANPEPKSDKSGRFANTITDPALLARIKSALGKIPATCDRDTWIQRVTMPIHDMTHGSQEGFELWHEWCASAGDGMTPTGNRAYAGERECRRQWGSLKGRRNPKGEATLFQLAMELGWNPPGPAAPIAMNGAAPPAKPDEAPTFCPEELAELGADPQDPGPFPPDIVPSLKGPIADAITWIVDAARRPDPVIALGASLGLTAAALGRRVVGPWESRPILTMAVLAPSGSGKDLPQDCVKNALGMHPNLVVGLLDDTPTHRTQLDDLLLKRKGQAIMLLDEYGAALSRWLCARDTSPNSMSPVIRRLACHGTAVYHLAPVSIRHPSRAANVSAWDAGIYAPAFSLVGFATPGQFYESVTESAMVDGFLGRHIVLETPGLEDLRASRARSDDPPKTVRAWLDMVTKYPIPQPGPPAIFQPKSAFTDSFGAAPSIPVNPWDVPWENTSASTAWAELHKAIDASGKDALKRGDECAGAMIRRLPGQVMGLALIIACGEADAIEDAAVSARHVGIAYQIAKWSTDRITWKMRMGAASEDIGRAMLAIAEALERKKGAKVWRSYFAARVKVAPFLYRAWPLIQADPRYEATEKWARLRAPVLNSKAKSTS